MQFTFIDMAGKTLFVRNDAERAQWTTEEMTLDVEFPYLPDKAISTGQRILFADPATGETQIYEVRQAKTYQPDGYQQVVAEHICISELSDEHIDEKEYYGVPPQTALQGVLAGTLWQVGTVNVGNTAIQAQIRQQIDRLGLNGNVDLTARPIIYPDKMKAAGYTDFDGDYATLYSMTYTPKIKSGATYTLLMTPIQQTGYVLSQDEIDEYVDDLAADAQSIAQFKAADKASRGLMMHQLSGTQIAAMDRIAEQAHDLSDEWEQQNVGVLSSGQLSRGSVWQAVLEIKDGWNVYITPRVTISSTGQIGRFLDIGHPNGTYNGVRLSVDKNMLDPSVTYDDSEVVTALYGYGGTLTAKSASEKDTEVTFADIVWKAEDGHPAKPKGRKYLEDPQATALYGRNGRPRFGYYANTDITDGEILLQKTWESLQTSNKPAVSVEGTVADLYRLGYADQPLRLHDIAIVEVNPIGYKAEIQIIRMTVDLLDPSATTLTIGAYIPNIVYIQRETNQSATGSRGGGGGNKSKETERHEFETKIESINNGTALRFRAFQNDMDDLDNELKLQQASITIEHDRITQEVYDRRNADTYLSSQIVQTANSITLEVSERKANDNALSSRITMTATEIRSEVANSEAGLSSRITQNANKVAIVVDDNNNLKTASIVAGINDQTGSYVKIKADTINLTGYVTASQLAAVDAQIDNLMTGNATATILKTGTLFANSKLSFHGRYVYWKQKTLADGTTIDYLGN